MRNVNGGGAWVAATLSRSASERVAYENDTVYVMASVVGPWICPYAAGLWSASGRGDCACPWSDGAACLWNDPSSCLQTCRVSFPATGLAACLWTGLWCALCRVQARGRVYPGRLALLLPDS